MPEPSTQTSPKTTIFNTQPKAPQTSFFRRPLPHNVTPKHIPFHPLSSPSLSPALLNKFAFLNLISMLISFILVWLWVVLSWGKRWPATLSLLENIYHIFVDNFCLIYQIFLWFQLQNLLQWLKNTIFPKKFTQLVTKLTTLTSLLCWHSNLH